MKTPTWLMSLCPTNNKASPVSLSVLLWFWWNFFHYVFVLWVLARHFVYCNFTFLLVDQCLCAVGAVDFCDASLSVYLLLKCSCWFSRAKDCMSLLRLSSVCSLLFSRYWDSLHMSLHPSYYASHFHYSYFVASTLVVICSMSHHVSMLPGSSIFSLYCYSWSCR